MYLLATLGGQPKKVKIICKLKIYQLPQLLQLLKAVLTKVQ